MTQFTDIQWPIDNLPKSCMFSLDDDIYSQFYEPSEICECGNCEWFTSAVVINVFENQIPMSPKRFQKCCSCKTVRMSKLKDEFVDVINTSSKLLKRFLECHGSQKKLQLVLTNMLANLEIMMTKSEIKDKKEEKILSLQNFCDDKQVDKSVLLEMMKKMNKDNISNHI